MSKATKVLPILRANLGYFDLIELVELISDYLEGQTEQMTKIRENLEKGKK